MAFFISLLLSSSSTLLPLAHIIIYIYYNQITSFISSPELPLFNPPFLLLSPYMELSPCGPMHGN